MVDFNNEHTVATPSWELLKILCLEKRQYVIEAIEFFRKNKRYGSEEANDRGFISDRLWSLLYELEGMIKAKKSKGEIEAIEKAIDSKDAEEIIKAFRLLNQFMYDVNLTKLDTKRVYDKTDIEGENELHNA